ncbi:hypothetical protein BBP40_011510 [Aspergillus hancockii]|nr:hypothetical protein BBP40_011510 [Aspergillus hancockii]
MAINCSSPDIELSLAEKYYILDFISKSSKGKVGGISSGLSREAATALCHFKIHISEETISHLLTHHHDTLAGSSKDFIDTLHKVGVYGSLGNPSPQTESQANLAGHLPGLRIHPNHISVDHPCADPASSDQPSLCLKAFAWTVKPWLAGSNNLHKDQQAIFLPALGQPGIPGGSHIP